MLDLLNKSWHQQLLVALHVPNNHQWTIHSNTYYPVATTLCSDAENQRWELLFDIPSVAHRHNK